ncbi:leucine-rich repeat extensin-like protein 3 [Durio zibethinus]|uniref:Leucine-rich repeat extensin-like protein 3 n=1 Tax=Durio zibethinus TaxID=66656 RepID=A0A6P6BFE4_DURZI|nr:leucine-rich repeat extensin-like protein 3 [Durio zibethinus]
MDPIIRLLVLTSSFTHLLSAIAQPASPISRITVVGVVFCDICSTNAFSRRSYFLPGVEVNIQCKFKAKSPKTTEQMTVSVNRSTDKYGVYKLEIPHVDGVDCVEGLAIESLCQASLIGSKSAACNVPGLKTSTNQISVKSKQDNLCIYSLNALSYRPSKRNATLCRNHKGLPPTSSFNSSKCIFPFPRFGFPWPFPSMPLPPLPSLPFPPLPPLPSWPFPRLPYPNPPSLPFPFPPTPSLITPPPPPPAFNLGDPRTWFPNFPTLSPPPPPAFNLGNPKTWIPYIPPSPPSIPQNQTP